MRFIRILTSIFLILLFGCAQRQPLLLAIPDSSVPYDRAWQVALETSLSHYDQIMIEDKQAGFFQTAWNIHKVGLIIGTPVRRSRLIGRVVNKSPFRLHVALEEEAFSLELGRWVAEPTDPDRLTLIAQDFASKLQRF